MIKNKVNLNKVLTKIIQIPTMDNQGVINLSIYDAVHQAQEHFRNNYYDYAAVILERVIVAAPKFTVPYLALAMILQRMGNKVNARKLMTKALELEPNNIRVLLEASSFFSLLYENERSYELIHKAYKLAPQNAGVLNQYAGALLRRGNGDDAIPLFKKALQIDPKLGIAYQNLATADIDAFDDSLFERGKQILNSLPTNDASRIPFLFAMARKYAKQGDIDSEFACLTEANGMLRRRSSWTWQHDVNDWNATQTRFTKNFVDKIKRTEPSGINPIVLATMPRSGTTLIEMILSSHETVCAAGESHLFHGPAIEQSRLLLGDYRYFHVLSEQTAPSYMDAVVRRSKEIMAEQGLDKPFVTDKTLQNHYTLGVILSAFPEAKVLHIERDPLDICLSCFQMYFYDGSDYTNDLADTARMCLLFNKVMAYWSSIFPDRIHKIRYADLVEDPETIARKMLEFCGLPWQEDCLKFYERNTVVNTASFKQVKNPINKSGLARWKKYEKHLQPAIEALAKGLQD